MRFRLLDADAWLELDQGQVVGRLGSVRRPGSRGHEVVLERGVVPVDRVDREAMSRPVVVGHRNPRADIKQALALDIFRAANRVLEKRVAAIDDDVTRLEVGQKLLDEFWRDFKPKAGEVMDQKPSEITVALDEFLAPWLYPPRADGSDPRICPQCGNGRLSLRGGKFGAFVACSNYPECRYTQKFGQPGGETPPRGGVHRAT